MEYIKIWFAGNHVIFMLSSGRIQGVFDALNFVLSV